MYSDYRLDTPPPDSRFRRQDASVEALDLAEYTPFRAYDPYPPSPIRSFSRETPSLISPGSTASSSRSPVRRPYSLPASYPHIAHDDQYQETEVDIGNFPAFSRHWYKGNKPKSPPSAYAAVPHEEHLSPFDPSFPTYKYNSHDKLPFSEPGSLDSHARNVLPWENEAQDQSLASVDGQVKQERMRMLEKEFAGVGKPGPYEETLTGSVDQRGRLITEGPRKRLATRYFQAIFTLGAAISAIYASVVIKPKGTPPPQGKPPIYILYVLSVVTCLWVVYLFLIYPSCCLGRRSKSSNLTDPMSGPGGMMILPVQHLPGGNQYKGNKKSKKGKKSTMPGGDVQVNLIVDPTMFGAGRGAQDSGERDYDEERWTSGSTTDRPSGDRVGRPPKRRSVFEGLAMEERWKTARKYHKWCAAFDSVSFLLWGVEFVLILIGKRCPSGAFEGWCDAYNFATALSCFACVLFGLAIFFDVKDLHASRVSPRTRT